MRAAVIGSLVLTGLLITLGVGVAVRQPAHAQRPPDPPLGSGLIALSAPAGEGAQQLTLIDPQTRVMGVYHVDRATGEISLRSVRNVRWDLMMDEFNGASPLPREIRSLLPR